MSNTNLANLPPLPPRGATGPHVCSTIALYLAVWNDLTEQQQEIVAEHARACARCSEEWRMLDVATRLMRRLGESSPSSHVDQRVMAAFAAQTVHGPTQPIRSRLLSIGSAFAMTPLRLGGLAATAALVLVVLVGMIQFAKPGLPSNTTAFVLPTSLSWSGFVLHYTETGITKDGQNYSIEGYYNPRDGAARVETKQEGAIDVVAVSDSKQTLGLDMMHHVAQWGAGNWMVNTSMFNLNEMREELRTQQATYLGKDQFRGQDVYRIRCSNGLVLLLDMHYMPVNVLRGAVGPGTGEPVYDHLQMLPQSPSLDSMWDMSVPPRFTMGALPQKPA